MNPLILKSLLVALGGAAGKVLLSLVTSLITEAVMKRVIILLLEKVSAKTANELDNQLLAIAKEAWQAAPTKPIDFPSEK